jgi:hypothetical protein
MRLRGCPPFRSPKVSISAIAAPSRAAAVEGAVSLEEIGNLSLKGQSRRFDNPAVGRSRTPQELNSLVASRYEIRAAAQRATPSLILVGFCALKLADRSDPITE